VEQGAIVGSVWEVGRGVDFIQETSSLLVFRFPDMLSIFIKVIFSKILNISKDVDYFEKYSIYFSSSLPPVACPLD